MNNTNYRALDIELQRQRYGENSDLLKGLGYYTDVMDIQRMAKDIATGDTWRYMQEKDLDDLQNFELEIDLYEYAVSQIDKTLLKDGLCLEWGTDGARTLHWFSRWLPDNTLYAFDSWQGLPEKFNDLPAGHFARDMPKVPENCKLVQGWFGERPKLDKSSIAEFTAQTFANEHKEPIALLHLDADLYSSTKTVLDAFADQIVPGTVILFNEYWNHATWKKHEFKAWREHVAKHNVKYKYIGYVSKHQEVAIQIE